MNCIEFKHISKAFQGKPVLTDISFSVKEGEIFGLLGPSGAGKTTILNILTGRLLPNAGTATLWGKDYSKLDAATLRRIGTVLDQDGLYDRLSCYDNLLLYAQLYNIPRDMIRSVLEKVQLQDAAKKTVRQLSKGMRQRLVLARAMLHSPTLLLLDEPTSGLDPATMQEIHRLLLDLKNHGTTIILTSHNMHEITELADTLILINNGQIVEAGTPRDICLRHDKQRGYHVFLDNGRERTFSIREKKALLYLFENDKIRSIHSLEPDLETVFIALTGRRLS